MAEKSLFFDTNGTGDGASAYTETELFDWVRRSFGEGVLREYGNELAVTGTSSPVAVATGSANVYGSPYENTSSVNVAISTPVIGTTGHRIVLRKSWASQTVRITKISSSDGVSAIPAATQTPGTTYDVTLATLTITTGGVITVTDARPFAQYQTNHVKRNGDNMTGQLTLDYANGSLELGSTTVSNTPYIDFHSSGNNIDYDTRIISSGGTSSTGLGNLNVLASSLQRHGNAVLDVTGRQGGSATDWNTQGTNNYTVDTMRCYGGATQITISNGNLQGSATVTFPSAFNYKPLVFVSREYDVYSQDAAQVTPTSSNATIYLTRGTSSGTTTHIVYWLAIGN